MEGFGAEELVSTGVIDRKHIDQCVLTGSEWSLTDKQILFSNKKLQIFFV